MNPIKTSQDWLQFVSKSKPNKVPNGIKVGIKGAYPRIEHWTLEEAKTKGLDNILPGQSIYLISGYGNGEEELLSMPIRIWKIYDELADFYNSQDIQGSIFEFVDYCLDTCIEVQATLVDSQNTLFGNKKLGEKVDYHKTISDLTDILEELRETEGLLMVVNNVLNTDLDLTGAHKVVRDTLMAQGIYLAQSKDSLETILTIANNLQQTADAKKSYGILKYRKDLKTEKGKRAEQAKVGKLLNHYQDLYIGLKA